MLLLDDSEQRHEIFRAAAWDLDIEHTYSIPGFRQSLLERERPPDIISLDHDLEGVYHTRGFITTCGCDACELVNQHMPSSIPVLIHSANTACAQVMRTMLLRGGRQV